MKTTLEKLQSLHESTNRHGNSNPSPISALVEIADFLRFDLVSIIEDTMEREQHMATLEAENERLHRILGHKVAV